jgi:hypothetical protein
LLQALKLLIIIVKLYKLLKKREAGKSYPFGGKVGYKSSGSARLQAKSQHQ